MKKVIAAGQWPTHYKIHAVRRCPACGEDRPGVEDADRRSWRCAACSQTVLTGGNERSHPCPR